MYIDTHIYMEQKYGTLTSLRRSKALEKRKALKDTKVITKSYVAFPAKLMVWNVTQKKYVLYEDFSCAPVTIDRTKKK